MTGWVRTETGLINLHHVVEMGVIEGDEHHLIYGVDVNGSNFILEEKFSSEDKAYDYLDTLTRER